MRLPELLSLEGEYTISADDVQELNLELSRSVASEIPVHRTSSVCDYLCLALLHETVDEKIKDQVEKLLRELQDRRGT